MRKNIFYEKRKMFLINLLKMNKIYDEQVFEYLDKIKGFWKYEVALLKEPDKFIKSVKRLIDAGRLPDIEFSGDYKYIKKLTPIN